MRLEENLIEIPIEGIENNLDKMTEEYVLNVEKPVPLQEQKAPRNSNSLR